MNQQANEPPNEAAKIHRIKDEPTSEWLPFIYAELRKLAKVRLANEPVEHTLPPTALVHEVYLRLMDSDQKWESRGHFFASAAITMQRILIENARRKQRLKHGGDRKRVELKDPAAAEPDAPLTQLVEALNELAKEDPVAAQVVDLHHFGGLKLEDVASTMDITVYQVKKLWTYARACLYASIQNNL